MRKKTALLLAMMLLVLAVVFPAGAAEKSLYKANGIELRATGYLISGVEPASLTLYVRVINNTDDKLWIEFKDSKVDGVSFGGVGRSVTAKTDTGTKNQKIYSFHAPEGDNGAGTAALNKTKKIKTTLVIQNYDTYKDLYRKEITIDLSTIDNKGMPAATATPRATAKPTKKPSTSSSGARTAPAYTPKSTNYKTLKEKNRGQAVKDLQQRLTDLGYLNDKVNGTYGVSTSVAVMCFCIQNGLYIQGDATPEMQQLLYSSNAKYYVEPWVPLMVGPSFQWRKPTLVDVGSITVMLVNRNNSKTIRGYELYYYMEDMWGNRYLGTNGKPLDRRVEMVQTIEPAHYLYSLPITVTPWSWTYTVYVGVHKIVFMDGEIRETAPKDIQYVQCVLKK